MYTIQFGQRAHFCNDEVAQIVIAAIEEKKPIVTVSINLAGNKDQEFKVTLNVAQIVALIQHQPTITKEKPHDQDTFSIIMQDRSYCVDGRYAQIIRDATHAGDKEMIVEVPCICGTGKKQVNIILADVVSTLHHGARLRSDLEIPELKTNVIPFPRD